MKGLKMMASVGIVLMMASLGATTFAYFTDTETATGNTFTVGTLDLQLSNDGTTFSDGVTTTWTSPKFLPGETVTATLHIKNTGSIGAYWLYIGIMDPISDPDGLASQIHVTEFIVDLWGTYNHIEWMATCGAWGTSAPMTLEEFSSNIPNGFMACGDSWTGTYDPTAPKIIPAGAEVDLKMTFLFDPNAGDEYQGKQCSFTLTVITWNGQPGAYTEMGSSISYGYGS